MTASLPLLLASIVRRYNNNNNIADNVYGAVIMTVIARVHPVHLMNADWAPGGRRPSDQTDLGCKSAKRLAASLLPSADTIAIYYFAMLLCVRFQELTQVWLIDLSLLLHCVSGITYFPLHLCDSELTLLEFHLLLKTHIFVENHCTWWLLFLQCLAYFLHSWLLYYKLNNVSHFDQRCS